MRSKYVFFTHGCFSGAKTVPAQVCVNVWHGMPIKKIGRYLDENHPTSNGDYIIATSKFFAEKVGYAFRMRDEQVLVTGLPRNDVLLEKGNPSLRKELCGKQKMVVWLPTYRKSVVGEIRMDGEQEQNVFNMPDLDMEVLDKMLGKMGVTAIVKPHPMAMAHAGSEPLAGCSNIKLIDETWLLEHDTTLYELLALSDALITDVSSVLIDYLVTDKPIICHFPDREMYSNSRGLIWDFKPDEYGIPVVDTQKELLQTIENVVSKGAFEKKKLKRLKTLSHEVESGFAKVLLDWVGKDFD